MSILNRLPTNTNFLAKNRYKLIFPRVSRAEYFAHGLTIPEISVMPVSQKTPFNELWVTGVNTTYTPFTINIILDEDFRAWTEIHDWMVGSSFPRSFDEYADIKRKGLYADSHVYLLNNHNVPGILFKFKKTFPIALGAIDLVAGDDGIDVLIVPVTFRYDDYELIRVRD